MKMNIYTVGHSNFSNTRLLERLQTNGITTLIDIRSKPHSRWCPQFNKHSLEDFLKSNGIRYEWRGNNLGGLGENTNYEGTLVELKGRSRTEVLCLMCTEREPEKCHRGQILTPDLEKLGIRITHIRYED